MIQVQERPYTMSFDTGHAFPMSSEEADRLIHDDESRIVEVKANRVVLVNGMGDKTYIVPATLGGGPAFTK